MDKKIILLEEELLENEKEISINRKKIDDKNNGIVAIEKNIKKYNQDIEDLKVDSGYKKEIQDGLKLENDLTFVLEGYDKLNVEKTELEKLVDKLGKALSTIKIQVNETEEKLKLLDLIIEKHEKSRPGERDDVTELIKIYHKHKSIIGLIRSKEKDLNAIVEKINTKTKLIDRHKKSQKAIGLNYKDTKFKVDSLTQEMTLLKMQIEKDTAYVISKNLKDGEPCPVCGSKDHPSPANLVISELDMDISNNIRELEDKFEESELEYKAYEASLKEIEKKQMYINEQIRNEDEQVTQLKVDLEEKEREIWKLKEDLSDEIRPLTTELAEKEIEKINDIANKKQNEIEQWEEMFNNLKERKRKGDEILNNYKVEEGKADSQLGVNKENLTKVTTDIKNNFQILNKKDKLYKEFLDKHSIIKVASELERIADNERRIEKLRELTKQQGEDVKNLEKDRDALQKKRQNLENQFAQLEAEHKYVNENKNEKRIKVKELGGEFNVEDEIKLVEKELSDIGKQEKKLSELLSKLSNSFGSVSIEKNTLESQQKIYKEDFERDQARLNLSLQDKGFNTPEEAEEFLLKKEKQIGLRDEINEYERVERNLSAQKDLLLKKVDGNSITEEEWNKVCHIYKEKAELKDKAISQYEVAKNNYERTKEKHKEWVTLNKENNTLSKKMNMLEQIKSLLRGNSFIDFVAEERLRYIAAESTEILGELTNFRYALELDTDMGFVIRDNANGGIHRMVASLSGGETFIASLSLALALSKQMQLKGQSPLEFFFLDEGFGTLDRDLLDVVIDALQKISTEDRAIGLISHVPELRNRIGRRLIVEPPTAEGRGSRINMEKA